MIDDVWGAFHRQAYDEGMRYYSPDCVIVLPGVGTMNSPEWEKVVRSHFDGHSDFAVRITKSVEDEDAISFLWNATGTHDGEIEHPNGKVPPTGASLDVTGACYVTVSNGLIDSYHLFFDSENYFQYQRMLGENAQGVS